MCLALLQVWHHLPFLLPAVQEGEGLAVLHLFALSGETQDRRAVSNPRDGGRVFFAWWVLNCPCVYGFEVAPVMRLKLMYCGQGVPA